MLDLLYESRAQKQAFADACSWAEDIHLCLAWIEPGDAHGPSFADLEPHQSKVRQAIVGLARLQSYPALLRRLYRASVLRLVSALDGSFSPNCYLFRNGSRVRILVGSAPFTTMRCAAPCEALVLFEGERDDPFVLHAELLLERCRASAHVPTSAELDVYEEAWAEARTSSGTRTPEAIAGLTLEAYDATTLGDCGRLLLIDDAAAVFSSFVALRDSLSAPATMRVPGTIAGTIAARTTTMITALGGGTLPQHESLETTLFWYPLGMWSALHRNGSLYNLHFGFVPPWEMESPTAVLSLTAGRTPERVSALVACRATDTMIGARAADGRRFLAHVVNDGTDNAADVDVHDDSGSVRATIIGEIGAADFVQTAAAFVLRTSRRRAARPRAEPEPELAS